MNELLSFCDEILSDDADAYGLRIGSPLLSSCDRSNYSQTDEKDLSTLQKNLVPDYDSDISSIYGKGNPKFIELQTKIDSNIEKPPPTSFSRSSSCGRSNLDSDCSTPPEQFNQKVVVSTAFSIPIEFTELKMTIS
ncbi:hypothetical protein HHI36_011254 [Cryptolaemus montrouzieri]|uniref:Uncharacterized protein n=1 Tax=Cryptolaemus montrouzieri TaxID=559131 RepID=A0ABD2ML53_9CUCU